MTARTLSKVKIFGPNTDDWRNELMKRFSDKMLPSEYGGSNLTCFNFQLSDADNIQFANHRPIPENQMKTVIIEGGEQLDVEINTPDHNCTLRYQSLSKYYENNNTQLFSD